jgi:hypothetical protein
MERRTVQDVPLIVQGTEPSKRGSRKQLADRLPTKEPKRQYMLQAIDGQSRTGKQLIDIKEQAIKFACFSCSQANAEKVSPIYLQKNIF